MQNLVKRPWYLKAIEPFIDMDIIKVLTGIRRGGKSVMLLLIQQELRRRGIGEDQIISLNFENLDTQPLTHAAALDRWVKEKAQNAGKKIYLFLDEIQEVEHWEKAINSLRVSLDVDIYITGSNAKLLSGELSTYLSGRYVQFIIYPFSYQEFLDGLGQEDSEAAFQTYLTMGGMPFLLNLNLSAAPSQQYLMDMYNSVVLKDIVQRNNIRDVDGLERIIEYAFENIGRLFSASSVTRYFKSEGRKISPDTVMNYLKAAADAYLLYKVPRYDLVGKKLLTVNEKYYAADHGLVNAVRGRQGADIDQVLENMVCLELLRRGFRVYVGVMGSREIDFIAEKEGQRCYVQVTYLLASPETIKREFSVYRGVQDNYPKYVVSMDPVNLSRDGIIHCHIRDFLLRKDYV